MTSFERDTAVSAAGAGRWTARCEPDWFAPRGPNGGYVAAIVLRAMLAELEAGGAADRLPRSLTLHYLRPPVAGEAVVEVAAERTGRRLSTLTARLTQDGRLCVLAVGAFAVDFPAIVDYGEPPPAVARFDDLPPVPRTAEMPPVAHRFDARGAIGAPPFSGADEALTGGWLRFADGPQPIDPPALAMLADAWIPAPFVRMQAPAPAPTVDLTLHFRAPEVVVDEPVFAVFRSRFSHAGFFEEDAELWSADGRLLAQGRQLALLAP